jgi:hypothetical protein
VKDIQKSKLRKSSKQAVNTSSRSSEKSECLVPQRCRREPTPPKRLNDALKVEIDPKRFDEAKNQTVTSRGYGQGDEIGSESVRLPQRGQQEAKGGRKKDSPSCPCSSRTYRTSDNQESRPSAAAGQEQGGRHARM